MGMRKPFTPGGPAVILEHSVEEPEGVTQPARMLTVLQPTTYEFSAPDNFAAILLHGAPEYPDGIGEARAVKPGLRVPNPPIHDPYMSLAPLEEFSAWESHRS